MTIRVSALSLAALLGLAGASPVSAQPQVPAMSPRPAFSPYLNMLGPYGPGLGYFGIAQPQMQQMQLNFQMQQQLQTTAQNLANVQTAVNTGMMINPLLPQTGRGATFNNLGHWYPMARNTSGGGGGGYMGMPLVTAPQRNLSSGSGMGGYGGMSGTGSLNRTNTGTGPRP